MYMSYTFSSILPVGADAAVGGPSVIHDMMLAYIEVKEKFVNDCTAKKNPTLEELKGHCIDLIECAFENMPTIKDQTGDIKNATSLNEVARIVCFRLSKWVSYDFFKKVIARFKLEEVDKQLMIYEGKLKPLLEKKLKCIAGLQKRQVYIIV